MKDLRFPIGEFSCPKNITKGTIENWINDIESFPSKLSQLTKKLTREELNWIYRPNGWTIKQVIHHCSDSHMNSFIRFKLALTENNPTVKPYEESKWAELIDSLDNNISDSLLIIQSVHKKWCMLLKNLSELDLTKTYYHPGNNATITLKEFIGLYAWHCNHHYEHIVQALHYKNKFDHE